MYDELGKYRTPVRYARGRAGGNAGAGAVISDGGNFVHPPVSEVNLTLWFEPIYTMSSLHLASIRTAWQDELPQVEEKAPLAPWNPSESISFVSDKWPMPACIFASNDREKQILVQNDRFGLTWYFTRRESRYPGFDELSGEFESRYNQVLNALRESENDDPALTMVTIEYENYLDLFDSNVVAQRIVAGEQIGTADQGSYSEGTTAVRKHIRPDKSNSDITLLLGVDSTRRTHGIVLDDNEDAESVMDPGSLTDRPPEMKRKGRATLLTISGRANIGKGDDAFERLRQTHDVSNDVFSRIFDDSLRSSWGER